MNLPLKTHTLNFLRNVFKLPILERRLADLTHDRKPTHFFGKLIPNHYQYRPGSFRDIMEHGIKLRVDIGDYIGHCLYYGFTGTERISYERLFSLCHPGFNVIDIGANIGYTSLVASSLIGTGQVIGFEPDPHSFDQALANLRRNDHRKNVRFFSIGLGDHAGPAFLEERLENCRGANRVALRNNGSIPIQLETLDDFFPKLHLEVVNLIKIDVEGYELKILRGMKRLLCRFKPTLFIEINDDLLKDQGDSASELVLFLEDLGYSNIVQADTNFRITHSTDFKDCHFDLIAESNASQTPA